MDTFIDLLAEKGLIKLPDMDIICNISADLKQRIIDIASNCPVRKTLSKEIKFARIEK